MRTHWAVLFFDRSIERTDAKYHEYGRRGYTACNRPFNIMRMPDLAIWIHRKNAEKFAQGCKRCERALKGAGDD
jgi:hypothetical protein